MLAEEPLAEGRDSEASSHSSTRSSSAGSETEEVDEIQQEVTQEPEGPLMEEEVPKKPEEDQSNVLDFSAQHEAQYLEQREKRKAAIRQQLLDKKKAPVSYYTTSPKENIVVAYAENFNRQYKQLYPGRKELVLVPENEFGVKKFICTTIRASQLPYKELYDYRTCASFVSDFITYEPLEPPHELPKTIVSPTYTLKLQSGNSFDMSVLLTSLLRGVGYDAYVVSGYATRNLTTMDQSKTSTDQFGLAPRSELSQLHMIKEISLVEASVKVPLFSGPNKYKIKPPRQLQSSFIIKQKEKIEVYRKKKEEDEKKAVFVKPSTGNVEVEDDLKGLRIHAWVIVLPGRREVAEGFFIESSTGKVYPLTDENFLGLESVFSSQNYWVNMQICFDGLKGISFDLGDNSKWEFVLLDNTNPGSRNRDGKSGDHVSDDEDEDENNEIVDLPPPWVDRLTISRDQFESRCPAGFKVITYSDAKWETFAEYHRSDGMTTRVTYFDPYEASSVLEIQEIFQNRRDKLRERIRLPKEQKIVARFLPGRVPHGLKEHIIVDGKTKEMHFYPNARSDGLVKRLEEVRKVQEFFTEREDRLVYRSVTYEVAENETGETVRGSTIKTAEKYDRDLNLPAHEDVYKRTFFVKDEKIRVLHHLEKGRIIRSVREFRKPPADSKGHNVDLLNDFEVNPYLKVPKKQHLYAQQLELLRQEQACFQAIKNSDRELNDILQMRQAEEKDVSLTISVYDTLRNDTNVPQDEDGKDVLKQGDEEEAKAVELDYLSPFLINFDNSTEIGREDAVVAKDSCLKSLKERLIEKANIIQGRLDEVTSEYQRRQFAYSRNADSMTVEETDDYIRFCNDSLFRIHILEKRLAKHKESAPEKYIELDSKLKTDTRLKAAYAH